MTYPEYRAALTRIELRLDALEQQIQTISQSMARLSDTIERMQHP